MRNNNTYIIAGCLLSLLAACEDREPVGELSKSPIGWNVHMDRFKGDIGSRSAETTGGNLTEFTMTSFVTDRPNYMDKVVYTKTGDTWTTDAGTFFWPVTGDLNFYCYAPETPGAAGTFTINKDKQVLENFVPEATAAAQKDFVYANEFSGGGLTGNSTATASIGLNFHHALSEITVSAKNENPSYSIYVRGIRIGNIVTEGDFTFPYMGKREADWTLSGRKGTYTATPNSGNTLQGSVQRLGGDEATFMLIPQQLTKVDKAVDGSHIALNITATSNGKTTYDGWSYVGIDTNWEMGKHYDYVIDYTSGGGQDENGNPIELEDRMGENSYILNGNDPIEIYPYARANTFWSNSDVGDASNVIDDNTEWTADVVWQDIPSRAINFCDAKGNTLSGDTYTGTGKSPLYVKSAGNTPGNVVVGIKKKGSSDYLWSWHLWITEEPSLIAGFMDRNLGATSVTPSDGSKTYGLYYQFGRKDPFVANVNIYDINGNKLQTGATIRSGKVTFADAVHKPGTFFYNASYPHTWVSPNNYTDKNWNDITDATGKTFFDPCPKGWKLPEISAFSGFSDSTFTWDATYKGRTYKDCWFPAAGCIDFYDGRCYDQRTKGHYWNNYPSGESKGCDLYFDSGGVTPNYDHPRAQGQSVRCVQE